MFKLFKKDNQNYKDKAKLIGCYIYNNEWLLVEMIIDDNANDICLDKFIVSSKQTKKENWQCPYLEQFLNIDGMSKICDIYDVPNNDEKSSRITFFIYETNDKLLQTPYGSFDISNKESLPDRLKSIIEFEEAD